MTNIADYNSAIAPTWCPGCGNFGIWGAIKGSLTKLGLEKDKVLLVYDIGCSGNMADFNTVYGIHALHGRAIPTAIGAQLARHDFPVMVIGGDGGLYGEGVEHFIEACRGNFDITVLVHNNTLYSLTTGQRSPTAPLGKKTKSTPGGVIEMPFQPLKTAIIHDAGYVARGYSADIPFLIDLIVEGIKHSGFSLIDILQPCPTFNKDMPYEWYQKRVYKLQDHQGLKLAEAFAKLDEADKLVTGVLYRSNRNAYHVHLPQLSETSLLGQSIANINIESLVKEFK